MVKLAYRISEYFLNKKVLVSVLDSVARSEVMKVLDVSAVMHEPMQSMLLNSRLLDITIDFIKRKKIESLRTMLLSDTVAVNKLFFLEKDFYFKNKGKPRLSYDEHQRRYFCSRFPEFEDKLLEGEFSEEHYTCSTAEVRLAGRSRLFLLSVITDIDAHKIVVRPILFGDKCLVDSEREGENTSLTFRIPLRVFPEQIDEFKKITQQKKPASFEIMKEIPEDDVKRAFAELVGEKNVPKDWGGEKSDLFTTHLHVEGKRIRAAFLFKGPAKYHSMRITDLGKNGDQIGRLFSEPADLFILQHCHYVCTEVEHQMDAFASRFYKLSKYMIIDGSDTLRIMKAYGKIKSRKD